MRTGFLILNLGTPDSTDVADVRKYLGEFLMDPHVLQIPWLVRWIIVNVFILPTRPRNSAHAYEQIWTEQGSPLLLESQTLTDALRGTLDLPVELAMRYGQPDIHSAVERLLDRGAQQIVIAPMYPHYADSTVTTSVEAAVAAIRGRVHHEVLAPFYDHPDYIDSLAKQVRDHLPDHWEHLLMSYHGIPEAHLKNADPTGSFCLQDRSCCLEKKPPPQSSPAHATCYRYQTYATSQALAAALGLQQDQYTISFQSRLGRAPWLTPYTDETLGNLPKRGIKHLVVVCPAFVADNLETLEEINMQGRETFLEAGGETFHTVPCLNAAPHWIANLSKLLQSSATESELFSEA